MDDAGECHPDRQDAHPARSGGCGWSDGPQQKDWNRRSGPAPGRLRVFSHVRCHHRNVSGSSQWPVDNGSRVVRQPSAGPLGREWAMPLWRAAVASGRGHPARLLFHLWQEDLSRRGCLSAHWQAAAREPRRNDRHGRRCASVMSQRSCATVTRATKGTLASLGGPSPALRATA